ncbi:WYL domain-containing protein [Leptospira ilyithenensis]|uniref:WYL domain-containing protein n=1 Tax=Leptospira ilyithenensis TaxID=2484901 RepID=A0A4V3JWM8_9LEPT|nr:WYL domain-containing protein [Leptospira ilyithenensis]TGN06488.1 WYL domain-containing protein [Leptospira ilyithenensis]
MNPATLRAASKLNLIRILSVHPDGLSLEDLQKITGHKSIGDLKRELGELFMIEMYPYSPQDCVEVDYDGEKVKIKLPIALDKALPLSPDEWILLRDILSEKDDSVPITDPDQKQISERILNKINSVIPSGTWEPHSVIRKKISDNIQNAKIIQLEYWKRNTKDKETRTVHPWILWEENDSYLLGFDLEKQDFRAFRLDCILEVTETNRETKSLPDGAKDWLNGFVQLLTPKESLNEATAVIYCTGSSAFHLGQKLPLKPISESKPFFDQNYDAYEVPIREENWFVNTILGYGNSIILKSPANLQKRILQSLEKANSIFVS